MKWVVGEMEDRYRKMSKMGVRNIDGYNGRVKMRWPRARCSAARYRPGLMMRPASRFSRPKKICARAMPYIVVIVDEMADLMMVAGKEIEACIQRLAQMARASGIHLIMATQRPSVDVITGTIKANFPTRISFQVTSKVDSRTILGEMGAEQLLGMGDMLYMAGGAKITRCHGPLSATKKSKKSSTTSSLWASPEYVKWRCRAVRAKTRPIASTRCWALGGNTDGEDALYDQAVADGHQGPQMLDLLHSAQTGDRL